MKLVIRIGCILLLIVLFSGAYYIINPSLEGEEIAFKIGIPYPAVIAHRGLFVLLYTINRLWQFKILAYFQSSGYITDRPEVLLEFLDKIPDLSKIEDILDD
ncbi:hypothetical protein U472_01020 [Orenia metallireducens]|uniref:Uncharacterized protein n=1 Tax=Orenia metallireducens TaxID=1413210 RepID=A0A1C0ACY9_9FIRM|nr:hypothetical protein [Orenia metallireducens]OCL28499.1 hypothetical protein U472_01020 [Orenia metallireducens]